MTVARSHIAVLLVQTGMPDYRQHFVTELERRLGDRLLILMGMDHFDGTSHSDVDGPSVRTFDRNVFLFGRRLLWQHGVLGAAIRPAAVVLELNPRVLSSWCVLIVRRLLRRRTVLWGHVWGRAGPRGRGEPLRSLMRRTADAIIVYTATQRMDLLAKMSSTPVFAAPNALYSSNDICAAGEAGSNLIWLGRMVAAKKPELAVRGFQAVADRLPAGCRLLMAGDGPLSSTVRQLIDEAGLHRRVELLGHIRPDQTADLFSTAAASVCTGYVGLNLVQSLSFGVPVLFARDEPHSPEVEAANSDNSRSFQSDDPEAVGAAMLAVLNGSTGWSFNRVDISADCRARYSVEAMVDGFMDAVGETALRWNQRSIQ